jgi:NADPH2:quinone reductase
MQAVSIQTFGSVDVLQVVDLSIPTPGVGEVLIHNLAVGVNFIDIYQRRGTYPGATAPRVLGIEGAGNVVAVGPGGAPDEIKIGMSIAYIVESGAYAEYTVVPADRLVPLPDGLSALQAAA